MPIYTEVQCYALSLLRKLRCVRHDQMHWLMRAGPASRVPFITEMRRLTCLGGVINDGTHYFFPGCVLDKDLIIALDIMRKLTGKTPVSFELGSPPCKLLFCVENRSVPTCRVYLPKAGEEAKCRAAAEAAKCPFGHVAVFYIESLGQIPLLSISLPHLFVCPDGDSEYAVIGKKSD